MKSVKVSGLTKIGLATSLALASMAMIPGAANAEVASTATISSMYLWRGQDISDGAPALSGDVKYTHASGFYAYGWMSSEGVKSTGETDESYEVDYGAGYAGKAGPIAYDVQFYKIWYPQQPQSWTHGAAEVIVALTYDPVTFTAFLDAKGEKTYRYYTLSSSYKQFGAKVGMWTDDTAANEYKHFDLTYNATSRLAFTYSKVFSRDDASTLATDPLIMMSYSIPVDLK